MPPLSFTFCHTSQIQNLTFLPTTFPEQLNLIDQNNFAGKAILVIFHMLQTKLQRIAVLSAFRSSGFQNRNGF